MYISVIGLGHLGMVTAACICDRHHIKVWDSRPEIREALLRGEKTWPHHEPGLEGTFIQKLVDHNLSPRLQAAMDGAEIVWITYDTPVDDQNRADYAWLQKRIEEVFPYLTLGQILLISSQTACGFTRIVEHSLRSQFPGLYVDVFCSPENIRRGKGLETFYHQKRILIGRTDGCTPEEVLILQNLLAPFCDKVVLLSSGAAEMSKHVLNAFLSMTIAFTNEVGTLCEAFGLDPHDIELALLTEGRIGSGLPLRYGEAYSGGTLARDVETLEQLASERDRYLPLLRCINPSNQIHKTRWETRQTKQEVVASAD